MGQDHDKKRRTWNWPSPPANLAPIGHTADGWNLSRRCPTT
jgi:hypothetical protein